VDFSDKEDFELSSKVTSLDNIGYFLSILFAFNFQIYSLDLRADMEKPTLKRMKKLNVVSNTIVFLLNIFICVVCYVTLGKKNLSLKEILYKKAFALCENDIYKQIVRGCVIFMFVMALLVMPLYNPSIRQIILDTLGKTESSQSY
jgi:hypothetical protein